MEDDDVLHQEAMMHFEMRMVRVVHQEVSILMHFEMRMMHVNLSAICMRYLMRYLMNEEVVMRYLMETVDACYDEDMTRILNAVDRYTYNKDMELICFCNGSVDPDVQ
eukprot:1013509_1